MQLPLRGVLVCLLALGACFSPAFEDGEVACGADGSCPPGLACDRGVCRAMPLPIDTAIVDVPADAAIDAPPGLVTLTLVKAGTGMGAVLSTPAGIDCGGDCAEALVAGTQVTLIATADAATSTFAGWSGGGCTGTAPACQLTVTAGTTVGATFTLLSRTITVAPAGNGTGTVTSNVGGISCPGTCTASIDHGSAITLTAAPQGTSSFLGWSGGGCSGTAPCTVTATSNVTINAPFAMGNTLVVSKTGNGTGSVTSTPGGIACGGDCTETYAANTVVTLVAAPDAESVFAGWSGGGCSGTGTCMVTVSAAIGVTAQFNLKTYALDVDLAGNGMGSVVSVPAGVSCTADCSASFDSGTIVMLTPTPMMGSTFAGWSGSGCTGTGTCTVTMSQARAVIATFTLQTFVLTVALTGNGNATVTSSPAGISCGADCSEPYAYNTMVTLTAMPAAGTTFTGWSGACAGTQGCLVAMTQARSVTANFTLDQHVLTIAKSGNGMGTVNGTVGASPVIACGADCTETVDHGTQVVLSATPMTGSTFTGWSGGGCADTGTCTTTVQAATTVTATFTLTQHVLTAAKNGSGTGTVAGTLGGSTVITCGADCSETVNYGAMVVLTATPAAGSSFTGWTGGGCAAVNPCTTTVTAASTVTATFALNTYALNVSKVGVGAANGTVMSTNVAGITCGADCSETYTHGQMVTLQASATAGFAFTGWGGACSGTTNPCTVTMTGALGVTASFSNIVTIAVAKTGTGTGTVTGTSSGNTVISCGADCSEAITVGGSVTLTAAPTTAPAAEVSDFVGWSGGGCSGTGMCVVPASAATTVTATFNLRPNYAFVTSTTHPATFGALLNADTVCQNAANGAGLLGTYRAWLSSSTTSAASRLGAASGWIRPDGKPFALTQADLLAGEQIYPLRLDPSGVDIAFGPSATYAWTGSMSNGQPFAGSTCSDWTSVASTAAVGNASSYGSMWSGGSSGVSCGAALRFFCMGVDRVAPATPPTPPAQQRRAFVTASAFVASSGLAGADNLCATEATGAGLTGTFRALLASDGAAAASRFVASGAPWVRPDGAVVSAASTMFTTTFWDAAINVRANGTTYEGNTNVFTGADTPMTAGTAATTCNNWTTTTGATATFGRAGESGLDLSFSVGSQPCTQPYRLYCLEL